MNQEDRSTPNQASNKSKAEGDRWSSDPDTVERTDRQAPRSSDPGGSDEGGGITNRPLAEEEHNQDLVPDRGTAREGAHAGHGDQDDREKENTRGDRR